MYLLKNKRAYQVTRGKSLLAMSYGKISKPCGNTATPFSNVATPCGNAAKPCGNTATPYGNDAMAYENIAKPHRKSIKRQYYHAQFYFILNAERVRDYRISGCAHGFGFTAVE